jgi:hypothetical protein
LTPSLLALLAAGSWAQEEPAAPPAQEEPPPAEEAAEDPLEPYRTPFDVLANRTIGTVSRPVEFNWRKSPVHVTGTFGYVAELNNFNTLRVGAAARFPTGGLLVEVGVSGVQVWDSLSSELLALTPYRQPGRPDRYELDVSVALPLAEGVVTVRPRFFPAVQMVFSGVADFRYLLYPHGFDELTVRQVAGAVLAPALTAAELANLEDRRLDAMEVDPARYGILAGFTNDLYFKSGFFLSPKVLVAVPLLAPANGTKLFVWPEVSLALGVAF